MQVKSKLGRRNKGSGTILPHPGGGYRGYVRKVVDGKRLSSPKFRGITKREVQDKINEWSLMNGFATSAATYTVGEFLDSWWSEAIKSWALTTQATHESTYRTYLCNPRLRSLAFHRITKTDVKDFFGSLSPSITVSTRNRIHRLLRAAFETAVTDDRLSSNPVKTSLSPKRRKGEVIAFHPDHEEQLIQYVRGDPYWEPLALFAFDSGCREQEVLGLRVCDLDVSRAEVSIRQTCDTIKGKPNLKLRTKTDTSARTIRLAPTTVAALSRLADRRCSGGDLLFGDHAGMPLTRYTFYRRWQTLLKKAGVPSYHFHAARHTAATRLLRAGMYITAVTKRLGHSKPSMTLDIYSSAIPEDQTPLAESFEMTLAIYGSKVNSTTISTVGSQISARDQIKAA